MLASGMMQDQNFWLVENCAWSLDPFEVFDRLIYRVQRTSMVTIIDLLKFRGHIDPLISFWSQILKSCSTAKRKGCTWFTWFIYSGTGMCLIRRLDWVPSPCKYIDTSTNQDNCFGPNGVHIRGVPLYCELAMATYKRFNKRLCMALWVHWLASLRVIMNIVTLPAWKSSK